MFFIMPKVLLADFAAVIHLTTWFQGITYNNPQVLFFIFRINYFIP